MTDQDGKEVPGNKGYKYKIYEYFGCFYK